jgi:hypothetical protein
MCVTANYRSAQSGKAFKLLPNPRSVVSGDIQARFPRGNTGDKRDDDLRLINSFLIFRLSSRPTSRLARLVRMRFALCETLLARPHFTTQCDEQTSGFHLIE